MPVLSIKPFLDAALNIKTVLGLGAFSIVVLLFALFAQKNRPRKSSATLLVIGMIMIALVTIGGSLYIDYREHSLYRVRAVVLNDQGTPVEDARVWSSLGGEAKKVGGGWQFDISPATVPADGKLTVYAELDKAFQKGKAEVQLAADYNPTLTIRLIHPETTIRGIVVDSRDRAVADATASVIGYGSEAVRTREDGSFLLPAHKADGQQVELHAEKSGLDASGWYPAGDVPATLILK